MLGKILLNRNTQLLKSDLQQVSICYGRCFAEIHFSAPSFFAQAIQHSSSTYSCIQTFSKISVIDTLTDHTLFSNVVIECKLRSNSKILKR